MGFKMCVAGCSATNYWRTFFARFINLRFSLTACQATKLGQRLLDRFDA